MTSSSREKRRTTACKAGLILLLALPSLLQGQRGDSTPPSHPDPDRVFIDAAAIVRAGGVQSLADVIAGRVPGLLVISGSGLNGSGSRIRFAGPRKLLSDDAPLILVDGIRVDAASDATAFILGGPGPLRLDDFNLEDIESIEVVSSPAAAMIHGAGAADGVILIRTKRGRSGKLQLDGYAQGWFETVSSKWPTNYGGVDADNPQLSMRDHCSLSAQAAGYCVQDFVQSFNPLVQRSPFSTAVRHHAGFTGTGGPEWGAFRLSAGLDGDGGVYDVPVIRNPDASSRWNVTGSGTVRPHPRLDIGFTVTRISSNLRLPTYRPIGSALLGPSDSSAFSWGPLFSGIPRQALDRTSGVAEAHGRIFSWLTGRIMVGLDNVEQHDAAIIPGLARTESQRDIRNTTTAWSLTAVGPTTGGLGFRTTVGWDRANRRRHQSLVTGRDTIPFCAGTCSAQFITLWRRSIGIYITEDISIRDRLAVTASLRYDQFAQLRTHQVNPLVRVSWKARSAPGGVLSGLRLRAAYGSASGIGGPDGFDPTFVPVGTTLPKLRPDRVTSLEAGADAQLLNGRGEARVTLYDLRSDVMQVVLIPTPFGLMGTFQSGSRISNRGIVATVSGALIDRVALRWDVQLSLWGNRNRLRSLVGAERLVESQGLIRGYPTGGYWGNRIIGYADANSDGIIASSEVALDPRPTWAGTPYPTQGAGLQSSLRVGPRVRISTTLDYRAGHVLFNRSAWERCQFVAVCRDINDPATPLARQAIAAASPSVGIPLQYFEDADYLKVRELQISYDLPASTARLLRAHEATITLAARNLLTWTRYSGGDPEAGSYGFANTDPMTIADLGVVPVARSVAVQVRVSY